MKNIKGKLVVITGYPASGQDTMMNLLLKKRSDFSRIVTHTDRPKRPTEVADVDYHFVTTQVFKQMITQDLFFEYVLHGSHYKGTVKKEFMPVVSGNNMIWRIDVIRAASLEETITEKFEKNVATQILSQTYKIMLKTEDPNEGLRRYKDRDPNFDKNEFLKRHKLVDEILSVHKHNFPHIITNKTGKQNEVVKKIEKIIERS